MAAYAFWLYSIGPAVALLRAELHFSYTLVGVYSALWSVGATLVAVGMAVEFCVIYFGIELLSATGQRAGQATTEMSGFYIGILAARAGAAWLTRRAGRTVPLLWVSLAVTTAGFLLFWLASLPVLAIAGLFVCGLGVANLYPLSLAITLATAPGNGDTAQAAVQLLGGLLTIVAPYLLGSLADRLGLHAAFSIELVLIGMCVILLLAGLRLTRRPGGLETAARAQRRGLT